jgi:hypothetical protein
MTEDEEFDLLWAEMERITRKVDPQRASKWGLAVAGIIHSSEVPEDEEVLFGKLLCHILRNGSVEWLDAFYREIRKLKVAADERPKAQAEVWHAMWAVRMKSGAWPGRKELRQYLEVNYYGYENLPNIAHDEAWKRLCVSSGLKEFWDDRSGEEGEDSSGVTWIPPKK